MHHAAICNERKQDMANSSKKHQEMNKCLATQFWNKLGDDTYDTYERYDRLVFFLVWRLGGTVVPHSAIQSGSELSCQDAGEAEPAQPEPQAAGQGEDMISFDKI